MEETWKEHLARISKSRSPRKLAALAENRKKKVLKQTPGARYQRARRAGEDTTGILKAAKLFDSSELHPALKQIMDEQYTKMTIRELLAKEKKSR